MDILTTIDEDNKINKYQIIPFLVDNLALPEPLANMIKNNIQLAYPDSINNLESTQLNDHLNHYVKEDESLNEETPHHNINVDRKVVFTKSDSKRVVSEDDMKRLKQAISTKKKDSDRKKDDDYFGYDR